MTKKKGVATVSPEEVQLIYRAFSRSEPHKAMATGQLRGVVDKFLANLTSTYYRQGNFTLCVLRRGNDDEFVFGIAKRNPGDDADVPERARAIALSRAVASALK